MNLKANVKAKFIGSNEIEISEHNKNICNFYSINESSKKNSQIIHHLLLIDVSLSMEKELPDLKSKLHLTLDTLRKRKNNYVSIIAYSGHKECYRIVNGVKCDTTAYKMANVFETLDEFLIPKGLTVISEPLEASINMAIALFNTCQKHNIILFTDGCVVPTKWSVEEETASCYSLASLCNEKGIFLNAIGFGNYYDKIFLNNLVLQGPCGNFYHINEINDFCNTIINIHHKVTTTSLLKYDIDNSNYFIINSRNFYSGKNSFKNIEHLNGSIVVVFNEALKLNGKEVSNKRRINLSNQSKLDFLYALAYYNIILEKIEDAEFIIAQTGDIYAYNKISNCYSIAEKGYCLNLLNQLISDSSKRFKNGASKIELTSMDTEPVCLLEILEFILIDPESKLLWNYAFKYSRIGVKTEKVEDNYKFIHPKFGFGEISSISIGSKKLNIGIKVKIKGHVVNTNNNLKLDAHIFREYNLIHNGNINTPIIWCSLSPKLKKLLKKEKFIKSPLITEYGTVYPLDLSKIKSTNKRLLKSLTPDEIAESLYNIDLLSCKQWAVKKHLDLLLSDNNFILPPSHTFSKEISDVKKEYRVDDTGLYSPLSTKLNSTNGKYELYKAKVLEWKIQGFPKTQKQEETFDYYSKALTIDNIENFFYLTNELKTIKGELTEKRNKINIVRLSCGLSNRSPFLWEYELQKEKREWDKNLNINMIVDDTINISTKVVNNIKIRQDKFELLTKIN